MELDEYKSKSPKEVAQIKALWDGSKKSNKKPKILADGSGIKSLMAGGAKTGTLTIGGQSVSFSVAAATTSTSPATVLQAKLGTDKKKDKDKEPWLSDEYKEARSKSASAQFGSKGQKQRTTAPEPAEESDRKLAALETLSVCRTVLSAGTGSTSLDGPIPQKKVPEKDPAVESKHEGQVSVDAREGIRSHPNLHKWKNFGMKFWAIRQPLKDLVVECDAPGGNKPSIETEIARLEKYTKEVVNASSWNKDKGATLDFEAWNSAQNGMSHTDINCWLEHTSSNYNEGLYDSEESDDSKSDD